MVCIRIVFWIFWRGVVWGALLGAAFGTFILPIVGTIYGFFLGALIGAIMGAIDAFALGAIAHFFMDLKHPSRIIPWLRLVGMTLTFIGVGIYAYHFFSNNFVTIVPPILGTAAVWILCPRFVDFAVRIQTETPDQPVTTLPKARPEPAR